MLTDLGICKGPGTIFCKFKIADDRVQLSRNGKYYYALLNNRTVLSSRTEKEFLSDSIPVLLLMMNGMMKRAGVDSLHWLPTTNIKKDNKMISDSLDFIRKNRKPAETFVLQIVPDEIQDQQPKEASVRSPKYGDRISGYWSDLGVFGSTIENIKQASEILLRTNLEKKMWGARDVMNIITASKAKMNRMAENFERSESIIEHSEHQIDILRTALQRNLKIASTRETAGKIIENFSFLKSFMSRLAQNLNTLYTIDKDFKVATGYPATWFFNPNTYMNFLYEYENLADNLIKTASLETEIIEPLLVWKMI
jgi:hypothetical protein